MLVEQLIRETLDLQGVRIQSVVKAGSELIVTLMPDCRCHPRCGVCGSPGDYRDTLSERRFRHVPLWGIPVTFIYAPCRVTCPRCKSVHVERMSWAAGKKRLTRAFAVTIATWTKSLPWQQVARKFQCSWGTVATAVAYAVDFGLARRDLSSITHIGIDEISQQKGHVYLTNAYDLRTGTLIWSGEGRTKDTLNAFFEFFGPERTAKLIGICCDMWPSYIEVVEKCTLCDHLLAKGQEPTCVAQCVGEALNFGDVDDSSSTVARMVAEGGKDVHGLPDMGLQPSFKYILRKAKWRGLPS